MAPIPDNPNYQLFYQLDEATVVSYVVQVGPAKGMRGSFLKVEHGTIGPFTPLMLSLQ